MSKNRNFWPVARFNATRQHGKPFKQKAPRFQDPSQEARYLKKRRARRGNRS